MIMMSFSYTFVLLCFMWTLCSHCSGRILLFPPPEEMAHDDEIQSKITLPYGYAPESMFLAENTGWPANPRSVSVVNSTPTSIEIKFAVESNENEQFDYRVLYKIVGSPWHFMVYNESTESETNDDGDISLTVRDLRPDTEYEFSVFQKSVASSSNDWTFLASFEARTKPCAPYTAPEVAEGSFMVDYTTAASTRTIRVFWKPLPLFARNGNGFRYKLKTFEEGRMIDEITRLASERYAIKETSLKMHEFVISACNYYGCSESSVIHVPAHTDMITSSVALVAIDNDNGTGELVWKVGNDAVVDETVLVQCDGAACQNGVAAYTRLPKNATRCTISNVENLQQTGIITRSSSSNSGLILPACQTSRSNLGQMNLSPTHFGVEGMRIRIEWPMQCPEQGSVFGLLGYNVYFHDAPEDENYIRAEKKIFVKTIATTLNADFWHTPDFRHPVSLSVAVVWADGSEGPRSVLWHEMA